MSPDEFSDPSCDAGPKPVRNQAREQARGFAPPRWPEVSALVDNALELAPEERAAYVAGACADDADLRAQVEQLLGACERAERSERFLAERAGEFAAPVIADLTARAAAAESEGPTALTAA